MKQDLGQLILIGLSGPSLTHHEKKFIIENNICGVTLFARNLIDPEQIHALCAELQSLRFKMRDRAPLFIGIDMEGGRVLRLKSPFTPWPAIKTLGRLDNPLVSFNFSNRMGLEMKAVGINLDYAPCLDILTNPQNQVIGDRSLGQDPVLVAKHGSALVRGYLKAGIISCVKHFPGHGNTLLDSHEDLPVEDADLERLEKIEFVPFRKSYRARVDMTMSAHIMFPKIDPEWPATLSEIFLKKMLRETCRFRGLSITDDLDMKALVKNYDQDLIPVRALQAGADLLLYCNEPKSPPRAIEAILGAIAQGALDKAYIEAQRNKILSFKKERLLKPDPMPMVESLKFIGTYDNLTLAAALAQGQIPENLIKED